MANPMTHVFGSWQRLCRGFAFAPGASDVEAETSRFDAPSAADGAIVRAGLSGAALRCKHDRQATPIAARCAPQWG